MANRNNKNYFVDSHLHLFNIDHIPIYTLLAGLDLKNLKDRSLETPKDTFSAKKLPDRNSLVESLTNKNPMLFLFGG